MEKTLLSLLRDAMVGTEPSVKTVELVWKCAAPDELLGLAEQHNILPLVGPLFLKAMPEFADAQRLRQHMKTAILRQIMAADALGQVVEALDQAEIPYLLVKGAACRSLYPKPEYRPSTDEDILVSGQDMSRAEQVFLELGYSRGAEPEESEVHTFVGPLLRVELHRSLTEEARLEALLEEKLVQPDTFLLEGRKVRTLPPQEHFIYLTAHFYKHFLAGGVGIRQVADMVLMAQQPGIRWDAVFEELQRMGSQTLVCGVLEIGEKYLGLEPVPIPQEVRKRSPGPEPLLEDILDAGVFGSSTMERKHSSLVTIGAVQGKTEKTSLIRTAFPKAEQLSGRYPYLKKRPWLLPVAWGSRAFGYLREDKDAGKRAMESASIGKKRVELLRQYDLIP